MTDPCPFRLGAASVGEDMARKIRQAFGTAMNPGIRVRLEWVEGHAMIR